MKISKITFAIATLSLVLFMSLASIANSSLSNTGDLPKSGAKSLSVTTASEKDFSYLRFDANNYINEKEEAEAIDNSLDYLRFDVNDFVNKTDCEAIELPVANEFEYLRFDVNNFMGSNSENMNELPANEFNYLRFDVNNFITTGNSNVDELPVTE